MLLFILFFIYYYDEEEVRYTLDCMSCYDVLSMFFSDEINRRLFLGEETVICAQKRAEMIELTYSQNVSKYQFT